MTEARASTPTIDPVAVARNLARLRTRVRAAGGDDVEIVAVTKRFGLDAVRAARQAGLRSIGENYAQELAQKAQALTEFDRAEAGPARADPVAWHFIGQLQSKRIPLIAEYVAVWQSVDRSKTGELIARHAPGARVMVQVNATGERQKAGCEPDEVASLVDHLRTLVLDVVGLMTMGRVGDEASSRAAFRQVRLLADGLGLRECSMGMSGDLEWAVAEGSTMIRVGTDLFGPRP